MILMIDNYDSFTYNLVQYMGELGAEIRVDRNDKISIKEIEKLNPEKIVVSPGPCTPAKAGISVEVVKHFAGKIPILGVCLGHQSVGVAFGGEIIKAGRLMHGKTSMIRHDGKMLFKNLPNPFEATRYHSLVLNRKNLPVPFVYPRKSYQVYSTSLIWEILHKSFSLSSAFPDSMELTASWTPKFRESAFPAT